MGKVTDVSYYFVNFLTCDIRKTNAGKPYRAGACTVLLTRKNAETFNYRHWEEGQDLPLGIYRVRGGFNVYEGDKQFILQDQPQKFDDIPEDVLEAFTQKNPNPDFSQDMLACEVSNAIGGIKDAFLRRLTQLCLISADWPWFDNDWDKRVLAVSGNEAKLLQNTDRQIYKTWGGRAIHHNYLGGLMAHSLEVLDIASSIARMMLTNGELSDRQKDIMVASSLLHDIGKTLEYDISSGACIESELGFFHKDHIFIGIRLVERIFRIIQRQNPVCDDPMILEEIVHTIATHHGQWFKIIEPRTFVSKLVQAGDLNSFAIARGRDFFLKEPEAEHLDNKIGTYIKVR